MEIPLNAINKTKCKAGWGWWSWWRWCSFSAPLASSHWMMMMMMIVFSGQRHIIISHSHRTREAEPQKVWSGVYDVFINLSLVSVPREFVHYFNTIIIIIINFTWILIHPSVHPVAKKRKNPTEDSRVRTEETKYLVLIKPCPSISVSLVPDQHSLRWSGWYYVASRHSSWGQSDIQGLTRRRQAGRAGILTISVKRKKKEQALGIELIVGLDTAQRWWWWLVVTGQRRRQQRV